ncbi:MAG: NUDIX hydrolase N-terminal domain-containing protein [Anaerolineae bacterium]|nr:NUDIX hydrolase N-terminal domain-containing protein [Anaerolineae bacterium]
MNPKWLDWAQRLQAIAQTGINYEPHMFDRERYEAVREIAAEIMAAHAQLDIEIVRDLLTHDAGHATPKVDVRGVVFHEGKILLVREGLDGGRWTLPGGWADINESPSESTVREVHEESGYHTRTVKLLALYDRRLHGHPPIVFHAYKVFFQCELTQTTPDAPGTSAAFLETHDATFFREGEIPEDLSIGRVTRAQIARFFEHLRNPGLPTDFD